MPHPRTPDPIKHCEFCQSIMTRKYNTKGVLEDLTCFMLRRFCSRRCMGDWQEGKIKILNAANSRRQAQKKVKSACQVCSTTSNLHVHHIDENPMNNEDQNLMTLCASCHRRWHARYTKGIVRQRKPCSLCSRPARRVGLCNTHYSRKRRRGDPLLVKRSNQHSSKVVLMPSESLQVGHLPKGQLRLALSNSADMAMQ